MYVLNIHNMPKIFWGAWPLIILERPKCSKVLVPLSKLSVSKNVWFTNARLGPLDFIHSEMLKRGMGGSGPSGKQQLGSTISGAGPPLGATNGANHADMHTDRQTYRHSDIPMTNSDSQFVWKLARMFCVSSKVITRQKVCHSSLKYELFVVYLIIWYYLYAILCLYMNLCVIVYPMMGPW